MNKNEQKQDVLEGISNNNDENYQNNSINPVEDKSRDSNKVLEPLEVLENEKQIVDTKNTIDKSSNISNYKYTVEDIDNFFASDNGQEEEHTIEESICRPLIGKHSYKPFFHYCKICPKVEFQSLLS